MKLNIPGLIIRRTELSQLHAMYLMGRDDAAFAALPDSWSAEKLAALFAGNVVAFTAARKKEVAGFIIGTVEGKSACLQWLLVKEKFRRRGIGSALFDMFTENLKKSGVEDFFVALFPYTTETESFFLKKNTMNSESFIRLSTKL